MTQAAAHSTVALGGASEHTGQQHPLGVYLKIWALLFVLSALSYMVDYFHLQGYLRWGLVLIFMTLKAGLIVAFFMHMRWERLALIYTILIPPLCLLVLIGIMAVESDYTLFNRHLFFDNKIEMPVVVKPQHH
ncbi:MAG: cytochrome C oxidase subunit IV family protein [Spongiibacteraceae bacterium]